MLPVIRALLGRAVPRPVSYLGGIDKINGNALESYLDALLFQDAVNKAAADGGTLNRQTLFTALSKETSFNADGIIGSTNIAAVRPRRAS